MSEQLLEALFHEVEDFYFFVYLREALAAKPGHIVKFAGDTFERIGQGFESGVQLQKLLDFRKGEADFVIAANEVQALEIGLLIAAIAGRVPQGRAEESFALVEADGLDVDARGAGQVADAHRAIVDPIPGYKARNARVWRRAKLLTVLLD